MNEDFKPLNFMEDTKYWLLTIDRQNNGVLNKETVFFAGNIASFILMEHELGRNTIVIYSLEITSDEYAFAVEQKKKW